MNLQRKGSNEMTSTTASQAKSITDVHSDAVQLSGLLDGLTMMQNEATMDNALGLAPWGEAIISTAIVAKRVADELANDIERINDQQAK